MTKINTLVILSLIMAAIGVAHGESNAPRKTEVPVDNTYIPKGFDSNDDVEVVVEGYLPNLCYQNPSADVKVKKKTIDISLQAYTSDSPGQNCAEMIVPFLKPVSVGVLDKGFYEVKVNGENKGEMLVGEASSDAINEQAYANVHYIKRVQGTRTVKFEGLNPSECMVFDHIEYRSNGEDTYSVLPVMKQVNDFCPMKMTPFSIQWDVPKKLDSEKILLHVRGMDGKSVNSLFYNR